jgi:hypothetical protein
VYSTNKQTNWTSLLKVIAIYPHSLSGKNSIHRGLGWVA